MILSVFLTLNSYKFDKLANRHRQIYDPIFDPEKYRKKVRFLQLS